MNQNEKSARQAKLKIWLRQEALGLGFADMRICRAKDADSLKISLQEFVASGYHGDMSWMAETIERRAHPNNLWSDVRSIIMLGFNYGPDEDPRLLLDCPDKANISVYARHRDYHELIKGRLKQLSSKLLSRARQGGLEMPGQGGAVKVFVDTAPVMEKPLAARAGLGWQGKHTNLVSRDYGSWLFLGSIFTNLDLMPDMAESTRCGSCTACLEACPTGAFPAPFHIDASRCISYLTIENKGPIQRSFRKAMGNRVYGCDDCLAACPWNKFAKAASEAKFKARDDLKAPKLAEFLCLDEKGFRTRFSGSPIKRIGRARFLRNVLIAAGNSGDKNLIEKVKPFLNEEDSLLRGHAVWALGELMDIQAFRTLTSTLQERETDPFVCEELACILFQKKTE